MYDLVLDKNAKAGTSLEIAFEAYAGHGVRASTIGVWNEEAYQLWLDLSVLIDIRNCLDENSLRVQKIDAVLKNFTKIVDFEQDEQKRQESYILARKMLRPLMECKNGFTVPTMYAFGHSYLDLAWLWPVAETKRKGARTFSNQLRLMDQYPEYKFLQSQPYLYEQVKEKYLSLYKKICEKVAARQM